MPGPLTSNDEMSNDVRIGFIGLGIMGRPMCHNLLAAGYDVTVSAYNQAAADKMAAAGADVVGTPREVAATADLVITMLPNGPQVRDVALGSDGIIEGAHEGLAYVDMSSIAPAVAREVHDRLAQAGILMLDAPVSGGEPKAIDGTLSIMAGGDEALFERVRKVLGVMGASVVHVGPIGAGNTTKLANQVVVALNIAAASEALVLARMAGVEPEAVFAAIRGGLAGSTVLETKVPMMLDRNFRPGFRIDLHVKDLVNALETADGLDAPVPLTRAVLDMMRGLQEGGHGAEDHSGIVQHYENLGHARVERDAS
jgi:2-hydroxy-3-oxopropionate reductase